MDLTGILAGLCWVFIVFISGTRVKDAIGGIGIFRPLTEWGLLWFHHVVFLFLVLIIPHHLQPTLIIATCFVY